MRSNSPKNLSPIDLLFEEDTGSHVLITNLKTVSITAFKTLVRLGGRNNVRTLFEEDIDIPTFDIPLPQEVKRP